MSDARSIRTIHHGAVGADDVHDAAAVICFQRALFDFVRFQKLGVSRGDVTPQSPCGGRAKLGGDARPRVFQEGKDRRCALEDVAYGARKRQKREGRKWQILFCFYL